MSDERTFYLSILEGYARENYSDRPDVQEQIKLIKQQVTNDDSSLKELDSAMHRLGQLLSKIRENK